MRTMKNLNAGQTPLKERRRYPRGEVAWEVTLEHDGGARWWGETVALNPFGAKVRLGTKETNPPPTGSIVRLQFSPPDGGPRMAVKGIVWRVDSGDLVVVFSNLSTDDFLRLKHLTDRVLEVLSRG